MLTEMEDFLARPDPQTQVLNALSLLPNERRAAYENAQKADPRIVEAETPVTRFLAFKQNDPWAAADALAEYWNRRTELFGERAFLPMTATGNGALNAKDLNVLSSGGFYELPPDVEGRPVLCFDRSRLANDFDTPESEDMMMCRRRIGQYMGYRVSTIPVAQQKGFRAIYVVSPAAVSDFSVQRALVQQSFVYYQKAIPIIFASVEFFIKPPRSGKRNFMDRVLPPILDFFTRLPAFPPSAVHECWGKNTSSITSRGFRLEGIPKEFGGNFCLHSDLRRWRRQALVEEKKFEVRLSGKANIHAVVAEEVKEGRRRRRDVLYSRQKRALERNEMERLRTLSVELGDARAKLLREHARLSGLVEAAARVVSSMKDTQQATTVSPPLSLEVPQVAPAAELNRTNPVVDWLHRNGFDLEDVEPTPIGPSSALF